MKSSFFHAQQHLAHFPGLRGGGAGPLPAKLGTSRYSHLVSVSPDCFPRPNSCTCSLPPKFPVHYFIAFSYAPPKKPYLILSPPMLTPFSPTGTASHLSSGVSMPSPMCSLSWQIHYLLTDLWFSSAKPCDCQLQSHRAAEPRVAVQQGHPRRSTGHALATVTTLCRLRFPSQLVWRREWHQK